MAKRKKTKTGTSRTASRARTTRQRTPTKGKVGKKRARRRGEISLPKRKEGDSSRAAAPRRAAAQTRSAGPANRASHKNRDVKKTAPRRSTKPRGSRPKPAPPAGAASPTSQDPIQFPEEKPLPKTYLTDKELRAFRELLLERRAELADDVERLTQVARSSDEHKQSEQSTMPIHMADRGSDNWEQEFTLGLLANERSLVREIDEALDRIEKKTYGICVATHKKISKARLRAKPWARYCIEYARAREEGHAP